MSEQKNNDVIESGSLTSDFLKKIESEGKVSRRGDVGVPSIESVTEFQMHYYAWKEREAELLNKIRNYEARLKLIEYEADEAVRRSKNKPVFRRVQTPPPKSSEGLLLKFLNFFKFGDRNDKKV